MLTNYFKIAWRSLLRNRLLSFINVIGLSLGMACSLLIGLWVLDERNVNHHYPDLNQLYIVRLTDGMFTSEITPGELANTLKQTVPEIDKSTKFTVWSNNFLLKAGKQAIKKVGIYATDDFFDIFQSPALQGNPSVAIQSPNGIVLTRTTAQALFGTTNVVGRTVQLNSDKYYRVGAVVEDGPKNASVQFDWLVNFKVSEEDWMKGWNNNSFLTYVKLKPNTNAAQAEAHMKNLLRQHIDDTKVKPILQPFGDTYLYGEYTNGQPTGGRISYVRTFSLIAILILLIACVNFMNLATARSSLRSKEVGIRKVAGARRLTLAGQFLGESLLLSIVSAGLAVGLVVIVLPVLNPIVDKQLTVDFTASTFWLGLLAVICFTSLVAGSYPALVLSAMQPIDVLKGSRLQLTTGAGFRKVLVVFQFSLSLFLLIGILIIERQMHYVRNKQLGLDRQNLLQIPVEGALRQNMQAFQEELQRSNAISSVTTTGELPIHIGSTGTPDWPGRDPSPNAAVSVSTMKVGTNFTKTLSIRLMAGRDFNSSDTARYLVNEAAVKLMNLKNPIGTEITFQRGKGPIIGVMQDFHLNSFHEPIRPLVLSYYPKWTNDFLIKTKPGLTDEAIRYVEKTAKQFNPGYPFAYHFVDEEYEKMYRSETLVNSLITYFGLLAVLISCLGLFGLATFTAEQRIKEIGVRKVLGASVGSIVSLLSKDFLKLVLVAIVIASPLAWYAMNQWLQAFAYRIDIAWWIFALAGLLVVIIALLTVSFQSVKAALTNPVKSLRTE